MYLRIKIKCIFIAADALDEYYKFRTPKTKNRTCSLSLFRLLSPYKQQRQQIVLVTGRSSLLRAVGPSLNHFTADSATADGCQRTAAGAISCPGVGLVPEFGYKTCHCRGRQKQSIQHFITSISHLVMVTDKNTGLLQGHPMKIQ